MAYILNVSSIASFSPMGYKTVYSSAKQFIHYFTRGLSQELRKTNIRVSVVFPGPMKTNHEITKRILNQGFLGRLCLISPQVVARHAIRKMFAGKKRIIIGWFNHLSWLLTRMVPSFISIPILTRAVKREIEFESEKF
jgi:uncharacterized protein